MVNRRPFLFIGRALGGVSTTLLYSVFEAWMIGRASTQEDSSFLVQELLSSTATINAMVAICAGFVSEVIAFVFASKKAPFAASMACLTAAASVICVYWVRKHRESPAGPTVQAC